jgi:hypothetical protein
MPQFGEHTPHHPDQQFRVMLRLLVFAYATRLFSSEDIVMACRVDPTVRTLCGGYIPFAQELRTFRRRHRALLERVLAGVFLRAVTNRLNLHSYPLSDDIELDAQNHAAERLEIARQMDTDD